MFPSARLRRLRRHLAFRELVAETRLHPRELVQPLFVREGIREPRPISSLPGQYQYDLDSLAFQLDRACNAGLGGVMLFGLPAQKDLGASAGMDPEGILNRAVARAKSVVGESLVIQSDVCLDEFTDHGHCGVLDARGRVDNDKTLEAYAGMALAQARAGTDLVGLSGMMDGQVCHVRQALDSHGFTYLPILAYAAKYASGFYGPFREAINSSLAGDRKDYQQDPANGWEALREVELDVVEGADILMIKPAGYYLDVLARVADRVSLPVWAYQVSGEYALIEAGADRGWIERDSAIFESVLCIKRAGAGAILTYWATELAEKIR